ncbi:MAG: hypothetical protein H0V49_07640 [Nocardioidaceae bacterium]|nr:hypothetical protein [Nocardioidaceae bacterium]
MSRRVRLPGADELFRPRDGSLVRRSAPPSTEVEAARESGVADLTATSTTTQEMAPGATAGIKKRAPSGRTRHDEKITIYVTADELIDLEDTRLALRRQYGLAVDRGRIVREAIHLALEGVDTDGDDSALVRRLREQ